MNTTKRKYFGTDGIRGEVGQFPITPDFILKLGYAAGKVLSAEVSSDHQRPAVLIGKDTRISGYMLESLLEAGLSAAGVDVFLVGPLPTPGIAYLTRALRLTAGIVISASHNPYYDNGIKFFLANGSKLTDAAELAIEAQMEKELVCVSSEKLGKAKRLDDAQGRYIEFCKNTFPAHLDLRAYKIVVDCAHGASYQIAPHVFHELGAEVISIGHHPDGLNINQEVGATAPEALINRVLLEEADLGIALDGDGDRVLIVDSQGRIYNGDQLLYAIVKDKINSSSKQGTLQQGVVGTLMSNMALENVIKNLGLDFYRAKVGDRYVLEALQQRHWIYGGESSGHILCLDKHTTGDGLIAALQVLAALVARKTTLAQWIHELQLMPQTLLNIKIPEGFNWQQYKPLLLETQSVEKALGDQGRILIRPSGTEPLLRIMVEAHNQQSAQAYAQQIASSLENVY